SSALQLSALRAQAYLLPRVRADFWGTEHSFEPPIVVKPQRPERTRKWPSGQNANRGQNPKEYPPNLGNPPLPRARVRAKIGQPGSAWGGWRSRFSAPTATKREFSGVRHVVAVRGADMREIVFLLTPKRRPIRHR